MTKFEELEKVVSNVNQGPPSTKPVYFTARATQDTTASAIIPFSNVHGEQDSGFIGSTGIMTAKISGLYYLTFSLETKIKSTSTNAELHHNGNRVCRGYSNGETYEMISCSVTIILKQNDTVNVKLTQGKIHSGTESCTFTGFLIHNL